MRRQRRTSGQRRLKWWHHATIIGALGVGALYLVDYLYSGMFLSYSGPGDPLWLGSIILTWHIVFGTLLGLGVGVWAQTALRPPRGGKRARAARAQPTPDPAFQAAGDVPNR